MKPLIENFIINSYDVNPDGSASTGAMLRIMQECACRHAAILKRGHNDLFPQGLMWVLSRLRVKFHAMPQWGDKITVKTWPSSAERIFFFREFTITNQSNNILITADSAWSAVDFNKGRVCRVSVFPELDFSDYDQVFPDRPGKLVLNNDLEPGHELQTRYMDLDMNNHVNNVRSVEFLLEFFTDKFLNKNKIASLEVNYSGQIDYGDMVKILGKDVKQNTFDLALQVNNNKRPATVARATFKSTGGNES
jgi:acyl-ACP thioesterase